MIANLAILLGFEDSFLFLQRAFLLPDEAGGEGGIGGGGTVCFFFAWFTLYVGVMLMQEIRAEEERRSQSKKF
jgi:hypothetical protein